MKFYLKSLIVSSSLWVIFTFNSQAQVIYEPTYKTVYGYLSRLAQKGILDLDDIVLPLSRIYISNKLDILSYQSGILTPLESKELDFYRKEYTLERNIEQNVDLRTPYTSVFKTQKGDRFRWGTYQDIQFSMNFQPLGGYEIESRNDGSVNQHTWRGISINGYLGKYIGYSFDFRDNTERGSTIDKTKNFSPVPGIIFTGSEDNSVEYNDTKGTVSVGGKKVNLTIGKDNMPVGYGEGGKLILSNKTPSFPLIRLDVKPTKWFSFNYAHIWLNSNLVDSSSIRPTSPQTGNQFAYRSKYMAIHSLTFIPLKGLSIMLGESAIYSDNIDFGYLIPVIFYRSFDHYKGGIKNNSISNSQIFFQLSSRNHVPNTHLYASFFVDEAKLSDLTDGTHAKNQTAYTVGLSIADFPFNNISLTAEYTKVRPFAYENYVPAQTYTSEDYNLGHWMGTNADQLYLSALWRLKRGLHWKTTFSAVRKGSKGTALQQREAEGFSFLFGDVQSKTDFSSILTYELIHDLFFKAGYQSSEYIGINNKNNYSYQGAIFGFNYGF